MTNMRILWTLIFSLLAATAAYAQNTDEGDDRVLKLAEPDFTLVSLPTSLRLPVNGSAFRVTHRFTRPSAATCVRTAWRRTRSAWTSARGSALEYRYGILPNTEVGVHRASDKTIELFGQYGFLRQGKSSPVEASALLAVEFSDVGRSNVDSQSQPTLGAHRVAPDCRKGGALRRADLGAPRQHLRLLNAGRRHVHAWVWAAACGSSTRSTWSANGRRGQATIPASATARSRSRSAPAAMCSRSTSPTRSRPRSASSREAARAAPRADGSNGTDWVPGIQHLEEVLLRTGGSAGLQACVFRTAQG